MNDNPQLENGYIRIANELFKAFYQHDFSKRQHRILLCIIRKTYGYNKKQDDMTITQLSKETGLPQSHCSTTIKELTVMKIIIREKGKHGSRIGINKNYSEWEITKTVINTKTVTPKKLPKQYKEVTKTVIQSYQNSNLPHTKTVYTKDRDTKDNPKRQSQKKENTTPGVIPPGDQEQHSSHGNGARERREPITAETWEAYSAAYCCRYGTEPIRNASVNGRLAQFVKRVGQSDAPHIAAFYVNMENPFYTKKLHPVGNLLADAESIATQWKTGTTQVDKPKTKMQRLQAAVDRDRRIRTINHA